MNENSGSTRLVLAALLAIAGLGMAPDSRSPVPVPTFEKSAQSFAGPRGTWGIESGDVDGDGDQDVVLATLLTPSSLLLNDGHGRFTESPQAFPGDMHDIALGDLDRDGSLDLFFVSVRQGRQPVYLNDGKGGFTSTGSTVEASERVQLVDLDNDGDLDAYLGSRGTLYLNDGRGGFRKGTTSLPGFAAIADLDGDGFADLIGMGGSREARGFVTFINDGKGNLERRQFMPGEDLSIGYVEVADIDNDGDNDVLYTNASGEDEAGQRPSGVLINDGTGRFRVGDQVLPPASLYGDVTACDLNGDGWRDIVVTNQFGPVRVLLNDRKGRFLEPGSALGDDKGLTNCATGDFDGDGDQDLFLANRLTGRHEVWFNRSAEAKTGRRGPNRPPHVLRPRSSRTTCTPHPSSRRTAARPTGRSKAGRS